MDQTLAIWLNGLALGGSIVFAACIITARIEHRAWCEICDRYAATIERLLARLNEQEPQIGRAHV